MNYINRNGIVPFINLYSANVNNLNFDPFESVSDNLKLYIHVICLDSVLPEAIVGPIITLGARWVVENIKFTKIYTEKITEHE